MSDDAMLTHMKVQERRGVVFIIAALVQGLGLWVWFWMTFQPEGGWRWPLNHLGDAWPLTSGGLPSVVAAAALWIGFANTTIVSLLLAIWWRWRADSWYRRGGQFVDMRGR